MLIEDMERIIPGDWFPMDLFQEKYKVILLPPSTEEFAKVFQKMLGGYYRTITGIYKVQNPFLYAKFDLKCGEYGMRGPFKILNLFHDTATENVESICLHNFDWRCGSRFMFGPGVYFSKSPILANKHSSKNNGIFRSMFLVDVLVQNVQRTQGDIFLPDYGFDTVLCHNGDTFVKYYDCEFYPRYFVDYICD